MTTRYLYALCLGLLLPVLLCARPINDDCSGTIGLPLPVMFLACRDDTPDFLRWGATEADVPAAGGAWLRFVAAGSFVVCTDADPIATPADQSCPTLSDGGVTVQPNGGNPGRNAYDFTIRDAAGNKVAECLDCATDQTFTGLPAGDYNAEVTNLTTSCPRNTNFTIGPGEYLPTRITYQPSCLGEGPIRLNATSTAGTDVEYNWEGPNGFSVVTTEPFVLTNDPADLGRYSVFITADGCTSESPASATVVFGVPPVITTATTDYCPGDPIAIRVLSGFGPFEWFENGNPIPRQRDATLRTVAGRTADGLVTYTVEARGVGCPGRIVVNVAPDVEPKIVYTPDSVVCGGGSISMRALLAEDFPFPPGWRFDWGGGASNADSITLPGDGPPGEYTIPLVIRNPMGCPTEVDVPYTIGGGPTVSLAPRLAAVCESGGEVELCVTVSDDRGPYSYVWSHDATVTTRCAQIDAGAAAAGPIRVTVLDATGCSVISDPAIVTPLATPSVPVFLNCDISGTSAVNYSWSPIGETYSDLYLTINGGAEVLVEDNYTELDYTVSDLSPGDVVRLRVVPFSAGEGTECIGPEGVQTCSIDDCESPNWTAGDLGPVCLGPAPEPFTLSLSVAAAGNVVLNSTDLGLTDAGLTAAGSIDLSLPPLPAGRASGSYTIVASYTKPDGTCPSDTTLVIEVANAPTAAITASASEACLTDEVTFTYAGAVAGGGFAWEIPPTATLVSGALDAAGPITLSFAQAGSQTVSLEVSSPPCGADRASVTVELVAGPEPPAVSCGPAGPLSVNFVWDSQAGVEEYELSVDGGAPFRQTGTTYGLDNLAISQEVTLTVTAVGSGICGNSAAVTTRCSVTECPTFSANFSALVDTVCLEEGTGAIDLGAIVIEGRSGANSSLTFSGPGVTGAQFDPAVAGGSEAGVTHSITLNYTEDGPCILTTSFPITVFVPPTVFIVAPERICLGDTATVTVGSTNLGPGDDVTFEAGGGTIVPDGDAGDNNYLITFAGPGSYALSATVVSNISGCPSALSAANIDVTQPPTAAVVTCGESSTTSVTFNWGEVAGAREFRIRAGSGEPTDLPADVTTFSVEGLNPGEAVTLSVQTIGTEPCADGPIVTLTCAAAACDAEELQLPPPLPTCSDRQADAVEFEWPAVPEADLGYEVSIDGAPFVLQTATSVLIESLRPASTVRIAVRSVRDTEECSRSNVVEADCSTLACPVRNLAPAASQNSFCLNDAEAATLTTAVDSEGAAVWTGPGVDATEDGFVFDPRLAGPGVHTLFVSYTEFEVCSYADSLVMTVSDLASTTLEAPAEIACSGSTYTLDVRTLTELVAEVNIEVDFGEATATTADSLVYAVTFPQNGQFTIAVTLTKGDCRTVINQRVDVQATTSAGTGPADPILRCVGDTTSVLLSDALMDADGGGDWSVVDGQIVSDALDRATGALNATVLNAGDYLFRYRTGGGSCAPDSADVRITVYAEPVADAGPDQALTCRMGMVSLGGSGSEAGEGYRYLWTSDRVGDAIADSTATMIDVSAPGVYTLQVTSPAGCSSVDRVVVQSSDGAPVMQVATSAVTCFGAADGAIVVTEVTGGQPPYRFEINGEDRGPATDFRGLSPQEYTLRVIDANDCFTDLVVDIAQPEELRVTLRFPGDTTEVDFGQEVFITAEVNGGGTIDSLVWQPDSLRAGTDGILLVARDSRVISVTVIDSAGCTASDSEMLLVRRRMPVYFPTAFSPNGDNNNDVFFVGANPNVVTALQDFEIYTRWGELVYSSNDLGLQGGAATMNGLFPPNDPFFGWDGTHNGRVLNPQVLLYSVRVNFADAESEVFKGEFVLMR